MLVQLMARFHEEVFGIYFDDLDSFQILHNARYLLLFERAVGAFWGKIGFSSFVHGENPDQFHLVRHNEVDYLAPVRGIGEVRVRVAVERLGRSSLTFGFRMLPMDRDEDFATGRRTVVHVDGEGLGSRPWSDSFRQCIEPWRVCGDEKGEGPVKS